MRNDFQPSVATWVVTGPGLPDLKIRARTSVEAIKKAKLQDPGYTACWVDDED